MVTFALATKVTIPSYPVNRDEEEVIQYHPSSDLNDPEHDIRKAIDGRREMAEYLADEEQVDPEATKPFADEVAGAQKCQVQKMEVRPDDPSSYREHLLILQQHPHDRY